MLGASVLRQSLSLAFHVLYEDDTMPMSCLVVACVSGRATTKKMMITATIDTGASFIRLVNLTCSRERMAGFVCMPSGSVLVETSWGRHSLSIPRVFCLWCVQIKTTSHASHNHNTSHVANWVAENCLQLRYQVGLRNDLVVECGWKAAYRSTTV